jgi:hypothetical protein
VADLGAVPPSIGGGGFAGSITAVSWGLGHYDLFGVGQNGHIVKFWYDGGWDWADLGAIPPGVDRNSFTNTITAASWGPGHPDIFGVDQDHNVVRFSYDGTWHWTNVGLIPPSIDDRDFPVRITAVSWGPGRYDVFGTAYSYYLIEQVFQLWYDGAWHWADLGAVPSNVAGGHFSGQIAAASSQTGEYAIFGLGWNAHVVQTLV